jgi:hypothetical protein
MKKMEYVFLLFIFLLSACTINEPALPAWDTDWVIHLPTNDWLMSESVDNDSLLFADTTAGNIPIIKISMRDTTDWERIDENDLVLDPRQDFYNATLDDVELEQPADLATPEKKVADFFPLNTLVGDTLYPYPDIDIHIPNGQVEFDHYERVEISSGHLWLTFINNTFLTFRTGMAISVYNGQNDFIDKITFTEEIAPGEQVVSDQVDLANHVLTNVFRLEYDAPIKGSAEKVPLTEAMKNSSFYCKLSMDKLKVRSADARIPAQTITRSESVDISAEEHKLSQATIRKGMIHVNITNHLPLNANVRLELPNFVKNGQPKTIDRYISGGSTNVENIDLADWTIENYQNPGVIIDAIDYSIIAALYASDGVVTVHATDSVSIKVVIDSLYLSSVEGIVARVEKDITPVKFDDLDFFEDFSGEVRLNDLSMILRFENEIDLPLEMQLKIKGYHRDKGTTQISDSVVINITETVQPAHISEVTEIVLDKDSQTPSIVDLLAILPTEISISGVAGISGAGKVEAGMGVRVISDVTSPLSIEIKEPITFESEVDTMLKDDIDQEIRNALAEDAHHASAEITLRNGLPVSAEVKLIMAASRPALFTNTIPDSSAKFVISGLVNPGSVDASGYVNQESSSVISLDLSSEELDIFLQDIIYVRQLVTINPTQGHVRFRQTDKIAVDGVIKTSIRMNTK